MLNLEYIESAKVLKMHTIQKVLLHFFFHCLPLALIHLFSEKRWKLPRHILCSSMLLPIFWSFSMALCINSIYAGPNSISHVCKAWTSSKLLVYTYKSKLNFTVRKAWTSSKLLVYIYKSKLNITVRKAWTSSKLLVCTDKFKLNFHSM